MVEPDRYALHLSTGRKSSRFVCLNMSLAILTFHITSVLITRLLTMLTAPSTPYIHRYWCNSRCSTRMFFSNQCCRFSKRREVSEKIKHHMLQFDTTPPRQLNIDYSVCQSLMSIPPTLRVITIYDVACHGAFTFRRE